MTGFLSSHHPITIPPGCPSPRRLGRCPMGTLLLGLLLPNSMSPPKDSAAWGSGSPARVTSQEVTTQKGRSLQSRKSLTSQLAKHTPCSLSQHSPGQDSGRVRSAQAPVRTGRWTRCRLHGQTQMANASPKQPSFGLNRAVCPKRPGEGPGAWVGLTELAASSRRPARHAQRGLGALPYATRGPSLDQWTCTGASIHQLPHHRANTTQRSRPFTGVERTN